MLNLKLSIIAAAYNEGDNLKNFFDFWLDQDYDNYEIIVVNDWSKDNTEEIIKKYSKKYDKVKLVNNDRNRWVWYTRYNWYLNAQGDVIKFSDTDIAPDYPHQRDLISRLMAPFNKSENIDAVYIDYYPYFDNDNFVRSLENFYYYSPVLKVPWDYKKRKIPSLHMPTLFRNKDIDLSGVKNIKNWEDRYIAVSFLEKLRDGWKSQWKIFLDVNNVSWKELYKRYVVYWKNSKWLLISNKKMFIIHISKPIIVLLCLTLSLLWTINTLFIMPFLILYSWFLALTIKYSLNYKNESNWLILKICAIWPFYLMIRYIFVFIWMLKME